MLQQYFNSIQLTTCHGISPLSFKFPKFVWIPPKTNLTTNLKNVSSSNTKHVNIMRSPRVTTNYRDTKKNKYSHSYLGFTSGPHYPAVHYGGWVQTNKQTSKQKGCSWTVLSGIPQLSVVITQYSAASHTLLRLMNAYWIVIPNLGQPQVLIIPYAV